MTSAFCIRNFICVHSQEQPSLLDDVERGRKNKVPVFHIFGVTDTGQKACVHVHGVLPYTVIRVGTAINERVKASIRSRLNDIVRREIRLAGGAANVGANTDYVYKLEEFKSRSLYGYHEEEEDFIKVYFSNPWYSQKLLVGLGRLCDTRPLFQPYEAHVPFHLQFFMDHSIFGMDMIHVKTVKFRIHQNQVDNEQVYNGFLVRDIRESDELLSPLEKATTCQIECDIQAKDILNAEMHSANKHSSNPGLEYIWREEEERCKQLGVELVDVFNSYEPRPSKTMPSERDMLRDAKNIARAIRLNNNLDVTARLEQTYANLDSQVSEDWETKNENNENADELDETLVASSDDEADDKENQREADIAEQLEMTMIVGNQQEETLDKTLNESTDTDGDEDDEDEEDGEDETGIEKAFGCREEPGWDLAPGASEVPWIFPGQDEEQPTQQKRRRYDDRTTRSKSREMTYNSWMDSEITYRDSRTPDDGYSAILSQSSIEEDADDGESDIVGLAVASLELFIDTNATMPNPQTDPIRCASLFVSADVCRTDNPSVHYVYSTFDPKMHVGDQRVVIVTDELELIRNIVQTVISCDIDILIGYDVDRLSWGYLMRRCQLIGIPCSMGRFTTSQAPSTEDTKAPDGRLLVAVWRVVRSDLTLRSYDRGTAMAHVLHRKMPCYDNAYWSRRKENCTTRIGRELTTYLLKLSRLNVVLLIEMNWFIKNAEMARVYGIQFEEVWTRGSQLRVESMLLRLSRKMGFVAPSITPSQRNAMSAPEQLQLILEPESKVYFDPVIVLDFQSLYPSMVIAYNYCYSTIFGKLANLDTLTDEQTNNVVTLGATKYNVPTDEFVECIASKVICASPLKSLFAKKDRRDGLLPVMLREILAARIMVKNAMKKTQSKRLRRVLDARQLALKLVANVSYGYTAANWSGRMPCAELADAILGKGRETLERAIDMVASGKYGNARVIYGDTDSMFVLVPEGTLQKAFAIGRRIAEDVTNENPDPVVLKLEKVYMGCVLETKKRYAGWMFEDEKDEGKLDAKGIETVRRDTAPIVSKVLEKSLELIFNQQWRTWKVYLNTTLTSLAEQNLSDFVFCKEYRGGYGESSYVPQKKIADSRRRYCAQNLTLHGERVPYLIIDGPPGSTVYSLVRSIEQFVAEPKLKINARYYLQTHIVAALRRVTDLLPTHLIVDPPRPKHCFSSDCHILGRRLWCIHCILKPHKLVAAELALAKEQRIRQAIRISCAGCISTQRKVADIEVNSCKNYSCIIKQVWNMLRRSNTRNVVADHKCFEF